jgi:hypothetical protein
MDGFMSEPTNLLADDEPGISEVAPIFLIASGLTVCVMPLQGYWWAGRDIAPLTGNC